MLLTGTFLLALASALYTGWASHIESLIMDSTKKESYIPWGAETSFARLAKTGAIPGWSPV
jgi:hypothetical protein